MIIVVATALSCPACSSFKKSIMPSLEREIAQRGHRMIRLEAPSPSGRTGDPRVDSVINWYPMLLAYQDADWASNAGKPTSIFNGELPQLSTAAGGGSGSGKAKRVEQHRSSFSGMRDWVASQ